MIRQSCKGSGLMMNHGMRFASLLKRHLDGWIQVLKTRNHHVLEASEEIKKKGYPFEEHQVTTEDGYKLKLHRIPSSPKRKSHNSTSRPTVLLQHGLCCSSTVWTLVEGGICYRLADSGCDVWLGNSRGNLYGRDHTCLDPRKPEFWNFSWNEIGQYDLPAIIDYILDATQQVKLSYIGHSQGTTVFFVMMSLRPEYNEKVKCMFALAPVAGLFDLNNFLPFKLLSSQSLNLLKTANVLGVHSLAFAESVELKFMDPLTGKNSKLNDFLAWFLQASCTFPCDEVRENMMSIVLDHAKNGYSTRQVAHFAQSVDRKHWFCQFDYGRVENLKRYGSEDPPEYDLKNIDVPVFLFYGLKDWIARTEDVKTLHSALSCQKEIIEMPSSEYNHLDFVFSTKDFDEIMNPVLANVL